MSAWIDTGKETEPDKRNRVNLGPEIGTPQGVRYKVLKNDRGQVLLDPVKLVPAYEAWFHESPERVTSYKRSIKQIKAGETIKLDLDKL